MNGRNIGREATESRAEDWLETHVDGSARAVISRARTIGPSVGDPQRGEIAKVDLDTRIDDAAGAIASFTTDRSLLACGQSKDL
jgi:hypothetical protein